MRSIKLALTLCLLTACRAPVAQIEADYNKGLSAWLDCLPEGAALVAAHRGTDRSSAYPENSLAGLDALIARGVPITEIDVAQTRDEVAILYHDGVWETGSNGRGAVAATDWAEVQTYSLRDARGTLRRDGVPRLADYLAAARGNIFLEIDFKTSADYKQTIEIIEQYDLINSVILIAYTQGQARKLRRLAPDAIISVTAGQGADIAPPTLSWVNTDAPRQWGPYIGKLTGNRAIVGRTQIAVTDYAFGEPPILGLTDPDGFATCVAAR